ncbi:MAG: PspC domain-containing protein [Calditrichia bacterium]
MANEQTGKQRLYRSKTDRMIGGVCGGLAEYFNMDSNLMRILFIILAFIGGSTIILYIAALIIIPENPNQENVTRKKVDNSLVIGAILIVVGAILLLRQLGFYFHLNYFDFSFSIIWGILLIAIGIYLLLQSGRTSPSTDSVENTVEEKKPVSGKSLLRSRTDKMLAGVCGGIAKYFNIDSSLVRLGWVFATLLTGGIGIIAYIVLIIVVPEEPYMESFEENKQ